MSQKQDGCLHPSSIKRLSMIGAATHPTIDLRRRSQKNIPTGLTMVLLEMSIVPLGQGESVSKYVAQCVDLVDQSGLDYELHAMGTIVEGELSQVMQLMQQCIEKIAEHSDRVTCTAKLDYRRGLQGRLTAKVDSVEQKLGRQIKRS